MTNLGMSFAGNRRASVILSIAALAAGVSLACARVDPGQAAPSSDGSAGRDGAGSSGGAVGTGGGGGGSARDGAMANPAPDGAAGPCVNLQCQQTTCPSGTQTTLSGTTYAPNGKLPLFNVIVYVPNAALDPFTAGVSCDRCGKVSGHPVASAISNGEGKFKIANVPAGKDIPLVVQVGKWRRKVTIPNVTACQDNVLTDPDLTRLPRSRKEGELPRIAATTGGCDRLGCLLPKIGVDVAELGVARDDKAAAFYKGTGNFDDDNPSGDGPPNMLDAAMLWRSVDELSKYDMALLSCECSEELPTKGPAAYDAMTKYLAKGGRIFGTDFMYVWYRYSTDANLAGALSIQGGADPGSDPMTIDTTFPKGKALADWMKFVDPTVTYGQIHADEVFNNFTGAMPITSQVWASSSSNPRIVTINTPAHLPVDQQCGRAVHIDAHVFTPAGGRGTGPLFPMSCGTDLNKAETALAFLFFDLAACIQDDSKPVEPPVVIP